MTATVLDVETAIESLGTAIRAADARAIFAASEGLAVAVRELEASAITITSAADLAEISDLISKLDALAIETNLHSGWTRQRIDSLADLRGQRHVVTQRYC